MNEENIKYLKFLAKIISDENNLDRLKYVFTKDDLQTFAELIRAEEREACAKMVDHIIKEGGRGKANSYAYGSCHNPHYFDRATSFSGGTYGDAIRARAK